MVFFSSIRFRNRALPRTRGLSKLLWWQRWEHRRRCCHLWRHCHLSPCVSCCDTCPRVQTTSPALNQNNSHPRSFLVCQSQSRCWRCSWCLCPWCVFMWWCFKYQIIGYDLMRLLLTMWKWRVWKIYPRSTYVLLGEKL